MPLPPALAAKLSKRGIITPKKLPEPLNKFDCKGFSFCPNKYNIYHECNMWCENHWNGILTPDPRYVRNMQKLLVKYPLPNNWTEIFDKGVGRYYYWNMENDLVSWLPPRHPKSVKTISAAKLREKMKSKDEDAEERTGRDKERDRDRDEESSEDERSYSKKYDRRDRERDDRKYRRERDERYRGKKSRKDDIDPMDPAAYSDIPVGKWSDGLDNNKGGADSSASGVLYQQRPYPAPSEVLASNKEKNKKK